MIWKTLQWAAHALFWIALALVLFGSFVGNRRPAKVLNGGRIEFAPNWIVVWAWVLVVLRMAFFTADYLRHGIEKPLDFFIGGSLGLGVLGVFFCLPGTIAVTDEGVEEVYWLRRNKRILWDEIVEINTGARDRMVTIIGPNGTKIVHSRQLADRPRLLLELKRHCGENLPPDFPREPVGD